MPYVEAAVVVGYAGRTLAVAVVDVPQKMAIDENHDTGQKRHNLDAQTELAPELRNLEVVVWWSQYSIRHHPLA